MAAWCQWLLLFWATLMCMEHFFKIVFSSSSPCFLLLLIYLNISVPHYSQYWCFCRGFLIFKCNQLSSLEIKSVRAWTRKQDQMIANYILQTYLLKLSDTYFCLLPLHASNQWYSDNLCGMNKMRSYGMSVLTHSSILLHLNIFSFLHILLSVWTVWLWPAVL